MSSARSAILGRVRASLKALTRDEARIAAARERITTHAGGLVPARAKGDPAERVALFRSYLEGQGATLLEAPAADDVPAKVKGYLSGLGVDQSIRMGADKRLAGMPWASQTGLKVTHGAAEPGDPVGLSHALCGIAETGTLVVAAGGDNPVTHAFVPATHIIVVNRHTILGSYEEAITATREAFGATGMPRTLNYISGPSRTADIGGKIVIGAHGPRNLCVVIVG